MFEPQRKKSIKKKKEKKNKHVKNLGSNDRFLLVQMCIGDQDLRADNDRSVAGSSELGGSRAVRLAKKDRRREETNNYRVFGVANAAASKGHG